MSAQIFDRVFETSTTTGTGALALAAAVTGFRRFADVLSVGQTAPYAIVAVDTNGNPSGAWEVGSGTYSGTNTLTRTTVEASSNANAAVNFGAGTKHIMLSASAAFLTTGLRAVPIMAAAMTARTTNGAAAGSTESTTNKVMLPTLDYDASTNEFAQFLFPMPKGWNEGTVTAQFLWTATNTGNVVWGIQGVALSDDDAVDTAFGTAQTVTDGVTAAGDLMQSAATAAMTIGGSPAEGDLVCFQVYRDASNGSDTCTVDAKLIGIRLNLTTNAADDS